jgi:hypothetical protein
MGKKKLNILLGSALIGVWALVMYKLFWSGGEEETVEFATVAYVQPPEQILPDSIVLDLEYRDPFLGSSTPRRAKKTTGSTGGTPPTARNNPPQVVEIPVEIDQWPAIKFSGIIENAESSRQVALVSVDGESFLLTLGDTVHDLTLKAVTLDSILIGRHAESRFISKR